MNFPLLIHTESGRKWMVIARPLRPEWWTRWSNDPHTYVPISSVLLSTLAKLDAIDAERKAGR